MKAVTLILIVVALVAAGACLAVPPSMTVDGQPFFPLGWFCSAGSSVYPDQRAQGMNSVLSCYGNWACGSCQTTYAHDAAGLDMKILFEVPRPAVQELPGYPLSLIDDQVNLLKNEPNFIGWSLIDEPELQGVTPEMAQARYAQVKGLDPNHPIYVVHSANEDWRPSRADGYLYREPPPYTDILMTDTYVVYAGYPEFANDIWKTASTTSYHVQRSIQTGKQAYVNVIQTHQGWGLQMPTYAEQRYLSYSPIVFGARGLLYWMYNGGYNTEAHKQNVVAPTAREIGSLIPAILSNSTAVTVASDHNTDTLGHNIPDAACLFGADEKGGYLIAVNNTANTFTVNFTLTGDVLANLAPVNLQAAVLFEGRNATLQSTANPRVRTISDSFSPYDVNVYRIYWSGPAASVDLGSPDISLGLSHLQHTDGDTTTLNLDGANCRRNTDASDSFFYFAVDDKFAYQGSSQDLSIAVDYHDSGTGSLELQYDSTSDANKSGGSFALTDSDSWKTHTFHVTDAYFANRQNAGADFRLSGGAGVTYYLDKVSVTATDPATPGPVTGFSATPNIGSVTLNWTNPANDTLVGTLIRYKTGGYPTSPTDGALLCYRQSPTPGSADSTLHSGLSGVLCYYTAFTFNTRLPYATAQISATPMCAPGLAQNYDSYSDSPLGGQDGWTTTGSASSQIQSAYAKGGTGKAILMDEVASLGVTIVNELSAPRTVGYYYLSLDTAHDIVDGSSGPISATLAIYSSDSATEICKLRIQKGKLSVDPNLLVSQTVANLTWCNVKIGFNIATRKFDVWFDGVPKFSNYSWKTGSGTDIAKIVISSVRYTGFTTQKAYIDNLALEAMPATIVAVTDDGNYTPLLDKLNFSFDQAACSGEYRYCIGTTSGGYETRAWTSCGASTDVTATGLSLSEGQQYFVSVQSGNGSGLWGQSTISDGITVAAGTTIPAAKGLADGQIRALRGKTVSAVFPGCFYVQEPGKPYGIKVVSSAAVSPGQTVDVAGEIKGAGAERYMDATGSAVLTATGPGAITPVSMSNLALGGIALNPLAPGVTDGIGVNNIGLLVRCWGKVSDISGTTYHISDGSGVTVKVQAPSLPSVPGDGTYTLVVGISSMDGSRDRLVLVPPSD